MIPEPHEIKLEPTIKKPPKAQKPILAPGDYWMDLKQASKYCRVSARKLRDWIKDGSLKIKRFEPPEIVPRKKKDGSMGQMRKPTKMITLKSWVDMRIMVLPD